jgi:hypothetical protein
VNFWQLPITSPTVTQFSLSGETVNPSFAPARAIRRVSIAFRAAANFVDGSELNVCLPPAESRS